MKLVVFTLLCYALRQGRAQSSVQSIPKRAYTLYDGYDYESCDAIGHQNLTLISCLQKGGGYRDIYYGDPERLLELPQSYQQQTLDDITREDNSHFYSSYWDEQNQTSQRKSQLLAISGSEMKGIQVNIADKVNHALQYSTQWLALNQHYLGSDGYFDTSTSVPFYKVQDPFNSSNTIISVYLYGYFNSTENISELYRLNVAYASKQLIIANITEDFREQKYEYIEEKFYTYDLFTVQKVDQLYKLSQYTFTIIQNGKVDLEQRVLFQQICDSFEYKNTERYYAIACISQNIIEIKAYEVRTLKQIFNKTIKNYANFFLTMMELSTDDLYLVYPNQTYLSKWTMEEIIRVNSSYYASGMVNSYTSIYQNVSFSKPWQASKSIVMTVTHQTYNRTTVSAIRFCSFREYLNSQDLSCLPCPNNSISIGPHQSKCYTYEEYQIYVSSQESTDSPQNDLALIKFQRLQSQDEPDVLHFTQFTTEVNLTLILPLSIGCTIIVISAVITFMCLQKAKKKKLEELRIRKEEQEALQRAEEQRQKEYEIEKKMRDLEIQANIQEIHVEPQDDTNKEEQETERGQVEEEEQVEEVKIEEVVLEEELPHESRYNEQILNQAQQVLNIGFKKAMLKCWLIKGRINYVQHLIAANNYSELYIYFVKLIQKFELNPKIPRGETTPAMTGNRDFSDTIWDVIEDSFNPLNVQQVQEQIILRNILAVSSDERINTFEAQPPRHLQPYELWYLQYLYELISRARGHGMSVPQVG
ncbi:hypothetical protein FGO68_gene3556 [Halteria grandinella]|uniref:Uncharacterized protein n=1 Tax=Halteria grandinella TaxID=5974 RepID=A0A8J8T519_HALGN|nr:hypothetical protein FGO68_gene3556 [Halteria grandinella]